MNIDDHELSGLIRRHASRHALPEALRAGVRTQVALAEAGRGEMPLPQRRAFGWKSALAGFVFGVAGTLLLVPLVQHLNAGGEPLEVSLVIQHVRALRVGPLVEVASSDRHVVKPWYQGRLDYAPPVHDFAADGFPLVGGRVEHLRGQRVAVLTYMRNRHVIEIFVWPGAAQEAATRRQSKGFNVVQWADGSMRYGVVSDLESSEMMRFVQLWQTRAAAS